MKPSNSLKLTFLHKSTKNINSGSSRWWDHIKGLCLPCFSPAGQPDGIPEDVPKGHVAVYVGEGEGEGEGRARYVVDISLLGHPMFRALLDQAAEVFDFSAAAKLCIPCNETVFLGILRLCSRSKNRSGNQVSCFSVHG